MQEIALWLCLLLRLCAKTACENSRLTSGETTSLSGRRRRRRRRRGPGGLNPPDTRLFSQAGKNTAEKTQMCRKRTRRQVKLEIENVKALWEETTSVQCCSFTNEKLELHKFFMLMFFSLQINYELMMVTGLWRREDNVWNPRDLYTFSIPTSV